MHLLAADVARVDDGDAAVDLGQPSGDIVILSAADTELKVLAEVAAGRDKDAPSLRLANLGRLSHPLSVDLYLEKTITGANLVVVRMMGGAGYWPYGLEQLRALARRGGPELAVMPGEDRWDVSLEAYVTVPAESCRLIWRYLVEGGRENARRALAFCDHLVGRGDAPPPPVALPHAGCWLPGIGEIGADDVSRHADVARPLAPIAFYRAVVQGGATEPIAALVGALAEEGITGLPVFVTSLKDRESEEFLAGLLARFPPAVVLNTTSFAVSRIGDTAAGTVLDRPGRPVLQVVLAGSTEAAWREDARGLGPRDLTMNVVLPEVDGRILTRAVSFKVADGDTTTYRAVADRVRFVARQAAGWVRLGAKTPAERKVALVLSNYPDRDGRIANGVGLDTPESAARVAAAMQAAGYTLPGFPETGAALLAHLLRERGGGETLPLVDYRAFLATLPDSIRAGLTDRWGPPENDPSFANGAFQLRVTRYGNVVVGIQPQRGYGIDPKATYHDRISCRHTTTWPSMRGSAPPSRPTRSFISASTAISNGFRARPSDCRSPAGRKRRWDRRH